MMLVAVICLLLAGACLRAQADLLGPGALRMLLMRNEPLRRHIAKWQAQADEGQLRVFALVSAGLVLFAAAGLSAVLLTLVEMIR